MTSPLDTGASGERADTEQPDPAGGEREGNRLLQQVDDRDTAHRLARRLTGHGLPDGRLRTLHVARVPLRLHVEGWIAVEFFPGAGPTRRLGVRRAGADGSDARARRARRELSRTRRREHQNAVGHKRPANLDRPHGRVHRPARLGALRSGLLIAEALGLPKVEVGEVKRYRRLTLLAKDARIEKVIFPPEENLDSHFRRVVTWIRAAGDERPMGSPSSATFKRPPARSPTLLDATVLRHRLIGRQITADFALDATDRRQLRLGGPTAALVVYLFPGTATSPEYGNDTPLADAEEHRSFRDLYRRMASLG